MLFKVFLYYDMKLISCSLKNPLRTCCLIGKRVSNAPPGMIHLDVVER